MKRLREQGEPPRPFQPDCRVNRIKRGQGSLADPPRQNVRHAVTRPHPGCGKALALFDVANPVVPREDDREAFALQRDIAANGRLPADLECLGPPESVIELRRRG